MKKNIIIGILLISFGCISWKDAKRDWSAGSVPCRRIEIETNDAPAEQSGMGTAFWMVSCKGQDYECSKQGWNPATCLLVE